MKDASERFRILLPATWMVLPLAAEGRQQRIRRLVRQRTGTSDELAGARYLAATELERAAEAAVDAGVFFAAFYEELFDDVPVSASLAVSVTPITRRTSDRTGGHPGSRSAAGAEPPFDEQPGDEAPAADDLGAVAQRMADGLNGEREEHDELGVVEMPLGPAVRCRSRARSDLWGSDGKELRPATVQYLVPLVSRDHMLVLSFSTPILPLADRFAELFDTMARTARID